MRKGILLIGLMCLFSVGVKAHAIKASTCIIDYNSTTKSAHIGINFFWDDFSAHLKALFPKMINDSIIDQSTQKTIKKYVLKHLEISISDKHKIQFIDIKLTENILHINAEIKGVEYQEEKTSIQIKNTLLLEAYRTQTNILRIDLKGDKNYYTFSFKKDKEEIKKVI